MLPMKHVFGNIMIVKYVPARVRISIQKLEKSNFTYVSFHT